MKKVTVVGVRDGRRVIHWPGLLAMYACMIVAGLLAGLALEWCWNCIFFEDGNAVHPGHQLSTAFFMSTLMLVLSVQRLRSLRVECLPSLDAKG